MQAAHDAIGFAPDDDERGHEPTTTKSRASSAVSQT